MISLRQLERFFIQHFGTTPRQWVAHLKCRCARELISRGYSNKAVVSELGFSTDAQFCHQFKRIFGVSPQFYAPSYQAMRPLAAS
jgi:AraC-like DNA-binding protein